MKNINIIKTLKKDIKELNDLNYKYNFTKCFIYNKYCVFLNAFITDYDSCFNKICREIQFKSISGVNKFIDLLNTELKTGLKQFI